MGADPTGVCPLSPDLLRLTELEVRVRKMDVVAVERVAARVGKNVSQIVPVELMDLVSAESDWLAPQVPGFAEGLAWPERGV